MPNVDVTVHARLGAQALRKSELELQARMSKLGRESGQDFGSQFAAGAKKSSREFTSALDDNTSALGRIREAEQRLARTLRDGTRADAIRDTNRLAKAHRDAATEVDRLADAQRALHSATRGGDGGPAGSITRTGAAIGGLGRIATPAALAAIVPMLIDLTGVAASATQSLLLLPAALGAVGSAFGTVKIATSGFSEALEAMDDPEKFAEALRNLSPAAAQAALSIRAMMPDLDRLKAATQEQFFAGVAPSLDALAATTLPTVQRLTTGVASAINTMFRELTSAIMTPALQMNLSEFVDNTVRAFRELAPAISPLTQALGDLMAAGSSVLPDLAAGASNAAAAFADWIREAERSGELDEWLRDGVTT
ncbi:MAG: hypothetical protein WBB00_07910 [Mycobacterium sp.]